MKNFLILITVVLYIFKNDCDGLKCSSKFLNSRRTFLAAGPSYESMLEQARLRKQNPNQPSQIQIDTERINTRIVPKAQQKIEKSVNNAQPVIKKKAVASNGLPFSDAMYDHLKFVIEKLTAKIKSDLSLSPAELKRFQNSVAAIIADAKGESQIIIKSNENRVSNSINDDKDVFSAFKGLKSTWEVKNSDDLSVEDFYKEVNKRNASIKEKRKALGDESSYDEYIKSLNQKNTSN